MSKSILTGGGQMLPGQQMHGVPGTSLFRPPYSGPARFMELAALTPFPKGTIRHLKLMVYGFPMPSGGKFTLELHMTDENGVGQSAAKGAGQEATGTGLLIQTSKPGWFERNDREIQVSENFRLSIKADNSFSGEGLIAFTYSFEFELT